jgi:hypothetical protein
MAIDIYRRHEQADGQFNGGEILEKKPIGFPQDGGTLRTFLIQIFFTGLMPGVMMEIPVAEGDFFIVSGEEELELSSALGAAFFMVRSPALIPYKTYGERYR